MTRNAHLAMTLMIATASMCLLASPARADKAARNTTRLPTYPHDHGTSMDAVTRSIPNGQHCMHYSGKTQDEVKAVADWYRKALPSVKVEDINKNSIYSGFTLDGVKLLVGNDFVNVYRMGKDAQETIIEIFQCNDAPSPSQ